MPLSIHLSLHFILAVLSGALVGYYFKRPWLGIALGILGGFFIDLDHVLEYWLVFPEKFQLLYFFQGRQFLYSEKAYLWFHAWEYLPLLGLAAYLFRKKTLVKVALISLAFSGSVHLLTDSLINQLPLKYYSLGYRASQDFSMKKLNTPAVYELNMKVKQKLGM